MKSSTQEMELLNQVNKLLLAGSVLFNKLLVLLTGTLSKVAGCPCLWVLACRTIEKKTKVKFAIPSAYKYIPLGQ